MTRKRAAKKEKKKTPEVKEPTRINPLMAGEGRFFQELVDASNQYAKLLEKESQYKFIVKKLIADRKKIQDGDIALPVTLTLIPKLLSYPESDKKKVLKIFDEQIKAYNINLATLKGQIDARYENFIESGIRNREFLKLRFHSEVKTKSIVAMRKYGEKDEETLFNAEFKDLVNDPKKQQELKDAHKEAIKKNVARKTKSPACKCKSCQP